MPFVDFLGMDVKQTPLCVEMVEYLDGCCDAVGGVDAFELGVPVFVKGVLEVCYDTWEETFSYGPRFSCAFPCMLHLHPCDLV